jgi:hypothetical protein
MVGITLSPEQIRAAPLEVRQWLEHQIAASLGFRATASAPMESPEHLVACTSQEAMAIYSAVRGMLPVVNVFFELGRQGEGVGHGDLEAFRLADIARHARLPDLQQLAACLDIIDRVFRDVREDASATLYAVDPKGYCVIASKTQQSIMEVWSHMVSSQEFPGAEAPSAAGTQPTAEQPARLPFSEMSGTVPQRAIHLEGLAPAHG